jgi:very-short-patch-repair endonuclease
MELTAQFALEPIRTTRELLQAGAQPRELTEAVGSSRLIRVRRGHYALPGTDAKLLHAVRIGGRLGCVSAAARWGIWVVDDPFAHVSMKHQASRLRSPADRRVRLSPDNRNGCTLHWWPTSGQTGSVVSPIDALSQLVRCQPAPLAIAALDSALNSRLLRSVEPVFAQLPRHYRALQSRIEPRCMSGIETLVRLMIEDAGLRVEPQVAFAGIGTVDFVVEGCVVIETDGRRFHNDQQHRDYRRDSALAARGYIVLRFDYAQVIYDAGSVMAAIRGALRAHRAGRATPRASAPR